MKSKKLANKEEIVTAMVAALRSYADKLEKHRTIGDSHGEVEIEDVELHLEGASEDSAGTYVFKTKCYDDMAYEDPCNFEKNMEWAEFLDYFMHANFALAEHFQDRLPRK